MKLAIVVVFLSACTSLGPMPATTGMSASPIGRPGMEAQVGVVPGFYASQSAQNEAKGTPIRHLTALVDPDRWLPVKGFVIGGRIFGQSGDTPGEPYVGYRQQMSERVAVGVIGFGSSKRSSSKLATYHGVRFGGETAVEARVWTPSRWASVRAQGAASLTRVLASGTYCVGNTGIAIDCKEAEPEMNHIISGKTVGVFPAATATLALDIGGHAGVFDSARLALLGSVGRMPLVVGGDETGSGTYASLGLSLTVGFGLGRAAGE